MNATDSADSGVPSPVPTRRRRLRAVFAADIANYGGLVTIDETNTIDALSITRRVAIEELATHGGWLFGMPGDGIFALFESTIDAVRCALAVQTRLAAAPKLHSLKMRIGLHLGEVLFQDDLPYGEALVIASRLESLAEPGGILVSSSVMDAVATHISATFVESSVRALKHSPRRIETFRVRPPPPPGERGPAAAPLDRTFAPQHGPALQPSPRPVVGDAATPASPPKLPRILPDEPLAKPIPARRDAPLAAEPVAPEAFTLRKASAAQPAEPPATDAKPECREEPSGSPSPEARRPSLDDARLGQLAPLLTTYIGPIAKVLVRRKSVEVAEAERLVRLLAQEIPTESERMRFLSKAEVALFGPP
jgi:class 3 adenylate cyclase